jgi:hypothetical protein
MSGNVVSYQMSLAAGVVILIDDDRGIGLVFGTVQVDSVQVSHTGHSYTSVPTTHLVRAADTAQVSSVLLVGMRLASLRPKPDHALVTSFEQMPCTAALTAVYREFCK